MADAGGAGVGLGFAVGTAAGAVDAAYAALEAASEIQTRQLMKKANECNIFIASASSKLSVSDPLGSRCGRALGIRTVASKYTGHP